MSCTNCFNGCAETVSDQCVKYTGIDVPALGISTGDNLLTVENAITNFLVPAINGTGIKPIIDPDIICNIVKSYLPPCTTCVGFTLNEILTAIVKTVCDLQEQIDDIDTTLSTLNANYTIPVGPSPTFTPCLSGVTTSSDTHDILQATINKLCSLNTAFSALVSQLNATNVTSLNVNTYIASYLASLPSTNLVSNKMVPYTPIPFYPTPAFLTGKFDGTGAGIGDWAKIYLCNGNNGTPDLRGRVLVGATTGMGGGTMNSAVDPNIVGSGNPNYLLGTLSGANQVTLNISQLPNHTHANAATAVATPHSHFVANIDEVTTSTTLSATNYIAKRSTYSSDDYNLAGTSTLATIGKTSDVTETITVTMTNGAIGSGDAHSNNQPAIGCYYIIYIP
jgi:microcystin-dependent protein